MHLQYSTASQTVTIEDTINHVPDKKSGRGGWERRGALAGFYGTVNIQNFGAAKFRHFTIFDISAAFYFRRGVEGMV